MTFQIQSLKKMPVKAHKCSVASHKLINRLSKLVDLSGYSSIYKYNQFSEHFVNMTLV